MKKNTVGRVTGPLGVLFILFGLLTRLIVPPEYSWLMWGMLLLGLGGIGAWVATAFDDARNLATGRGTVFVATTAVSTLVLVAVLAAVNYVAEKKKLEWDLTKGGIHTLAEQTQGVLKGLDEKTKVTVTAFFRPADPEYAALEELLRRYKNLGKDGFEYEFVDIYKSQQRARAMSVTQSSPRIILRNAAGKEARAKEISEESLTNALVELQRGAEKKLYFLTNHGEKTLDPKAANTPEGINLWVDGLRNEGWQSETLSLLKQKEVPADAAAVIVAGPKAPLSEPEIAALKTYAEGGGRLVVMADPGFDTGLETLLAEWGVELQKGVVVDPESQEPLWAFTQEFSEHPIATPRMSLFGALAFVFPDARGVVKAADAKGHTVTELFKTGASAWGENAPIDRQGGSVSRDPADDPGPIVLGAATSRKLDGDKEFRAVVFGDSDFAGNSFIRQGGNRDLALNAVQWLGGQEQKITIRPKMREKSTMAFLTAGKQVAVRFFSFTVLPLALIAAGLTVWTFRRSK